MKVDLSTFSNDWFTVGASKFKIVIWYFTNVIFFLNPVNPLSGLKVFLLRLFGAKVGVGVTIKQSVNIKYPWKLTIGDHVWIGEKVWIDNLAEVLIEDHVCISQGAMLLCGNHNYKKTTFDLIVEPIVLQEGSWVGAKSVVCPGVIVASHAILSVGSIATKNLESYTIYQGNPVKPVRKRIIE